MLSSAIYQLREIFQAPEFEQFVEHFMQDTFKEQEPYSQLSNSCEELFPDESYHLGSSVFPTSGFHSQPPDHQQDSSCPPAKLQVDLQRTKTSRRLVWTKELHRHFLQAVKDLGQDGSFYSFIPWIELIKTPSETERDRRKDEHRRPDRKEHLESSTEVQTPQNKRIRGKETNYLYQNRRTVPNR